AARARRSRPSCCVRSATTPATTSARGTNGRAATACQSKSESGSGNGEERAAEPAAVLLPGAELLVELRRELLERPRQCRFLAEPLEQLVAARLRMELHAPG